MDLGLAGKKAIVLGGSRGIGRATAALLLQEGASVALCARGGAGVDAAVSELSVSGSVVGASVDLADADATSAFVVKAIEQLCGAEALYQAFGPLPSQRADLPMHPRH